MSSFIASSWLTECSKQCKVSCLWFLPLLELIPQDKIVAYNSFIKKKMSISTTLNQCSFAKQQPGKAAELKGMDLISFINTGLISVTILLPVFNRRECCQLTTRLMVRTSLHISARRGKNKPTHTKPHLSCPFTKLI